MNSAFFRSNALWNFVRQLGQRVRGVLSGFDRLLFRGTLRCVIDPRGLNGSLYRAKVARADDGKPVEDVSRRLKDASLAEARKAGGQIRSLESIQERKKDIALDIAEHDGVRDSGGLIGVLSCVEPRATFDVRRDPVAQKITLVRRWRKCLHLYHDFHHERFGLMRVRLQTWFPFSMQVCLNGREKPDGTSTRPRPFRALNPLSPADIQLLTIIAQPKFGIAGLRNADVRVALFGDDPTDNAKELRRRSAAVSRQWWLLRRTRSSTCRVGLAEKAAASTTALPRRVPSDHRGVPGCRL